MSIATGQRVLGILDHEDTPAGIVVNKASEPDDAARVAEALGRSVDGVVPFDPEVRRREATGPLIGLLVDSPAAGGR